MKIALIMPPIDTGKKTNSFFKIIHDSAKGKPYWNNLLTPVTKRLNTIDFEAYPNGLIQLATILRQKHEVKIFNFLLDSKIQDILKFKPEFIGITCSTGSNLVWIDAFSKVLKEKLGCIIAFGGPHVTLSPIQSLKTTVADYIFIGEPDLIILDLLKYIEGKTKKILKQGLCYRKKDKIIKLPIAIIKDLSKLPMPDHTFLDLKKYTSITVESSRGCVRQCPFCYFSGFEKKCFWRGYPIEMKIKEIKSINENVDMNNKKIYFIDSNFAVNNTRVKKLCKDIILNKLQNHMLAATDTFVDYDTLKLMRKSGFCHVYIGVETGSSRFINKFNKFKSQQRVIDFFNKVKKTGIVPQANFVLMNPDESKKEIGDTFKLAKKLANLPIRDSATGAKTMFVAHLFRPYPNTLDYFSLIKKGWNPPKSLRDWGYFFDEVSNGNFKRYNFTKDINKAYLVNILIKFSLLNFREFIIPRSLNMIKNKIVD
ncbi:hypothetical protein AUJ10_01095 [Candidatus Pacearchaeota archaeon CG1_02_31_27]|nr:MAG: hypothetical protein AUJ10_01095 [Candidatus Pacearchaeota archaeon CG1_02_31_27]